MFQLALDILIPAAVLYGIFRFVFWIKNKKS